MANQVCCSGKHIAFEVNAAYIQPGLSFGILVIATGWKFDSVAITIDAAEFNTNFTASAKFQSSLDGEMKQITPSGKKLDPLISMAAKQFESSQNLAEKPADDSSVDESNKATEESTQSAREPVKDPNVSANQADITKTLAKSLGVATTNVTKMLGPESHKEIWETQFMKWACLALGVSIPKVLSFGCQFAFDFGLDVEFFR